MILRRSAYLSSHDIGNSGSQGQEDVDTTERPDVAAALERFGERAGAPGKGLRPSDEAAGFVVAESRNAHGVSVKEYQRASAGMLGTAVSEASNSPSRDRTTKQHSGRLTPLRDGGRYRAEGVLSPFDACQGVRVQSL